MISAQGITTIRFEEDAYKKACRLLKECLAKYEIECFVLGNPKHMNGDIGVSSQRSLDFKERLEKEFSLKVVLWDERLSSVLVDKSMIEMNLSRKKRKKVIDEMAAINILQGYLDSIR
ncbi:putative Holliday junction resolvase [Bacilli bacterium PM5-3]|nr:putative Holliday junction resolvase [Bacilli bacterium PM5-3]MDH6603501.1 putative Holliday junction resolvase [Bacilli bacterium PM5-9]